MAAPPEIDAKKLIGSFKASYFLFSLGKGTRTGIVKLCETKSSAPMKTGYFVIVLVSRESVYQRPSNGRCGRDMNRFD